MLVDLHMHSNASDGQYTPIQLVEKAKFAGVECLAITDHDTIDGLKEAQMQCKISNVKFIRGVELGAKEYKSLHILGLGFDEDCTSISKLCDIMRKSRDERKYRIIDFLKEKKVNISLEEVEELAGGNVIARPHFAQIMKKYGYVKTNKEAFDKYLDTDEYQHIERFKADAMTCIDVIHKSGGKAVFAHPYQLKLDDDMLESVVAKLKNYGLDGIEAYYSKHTQTMTENYLKLAEKYNLNVTAGSDFHGEHVKPDVRFMPTQLDVSWILN